MSVESQNPPLIPWLLAAGRLPGATVFDHRFGLGATICQPSSRTWIEQNLVDSVSGGQAPEDVAPRRGRLHLRQRQLLIAVPQRGLTGPAEFAKLLKHPINGLLHLQVRTLFDAVVIRAYKAYRYLPPPGASTDFIFERLPGALPHHPQCIFGHRAFHPQHQAIVALTGIIDAISIDSEGIGQSA
jgi:hypothetical protein